MTINNQLVAFNQELVTNFRQNYRPMPWIRGNTLVFLRSLKTYCNKMKNAQNSLFFDGLLKEAAKKDANLDKVAEQLLELRETVKAEGDPLVVKLLRMAAEHLKNNGSFELSDKFEEPLPDDVSNLEYFIQLIAESQNKFNREELQEFKAVLAQG